MEENRSLIAKAKELIGFDKHLKPEQVECLISALEGQDVMAVLPTGFGKSLVFQLAPFVIGLKRGNSVDNIDCCALVITPLNSIMVDQCQSLCKMGIRACALDYTCVHAETFTNDSDSDHSDTENESILTTVSLDDIVRGKYQVVYAHPEALLQTARGERLLNRLSHSKRLACVAVDEAHMILEWQVFFQISIPLMHQSYESHTHWGRGIAGVLTFSIFKALHSRAIYGKIPAKCPPPLPGLAIMNNKMSKSFE